MVVAKWVASGTVCVFCALRYRGVSFAKRIQLSFKESVALLEENISLPDPTHQSIFLPIPQEGKKQQKCIICFNLFHKINSPSFKTSFFSSLSSSRHSLRLPSDVALHLQTPHLVAHRIALQLLGREYSSTDKATELRQDLRSLLLSKICSFISSPTSSPSSSSSSSSSPSSPSSALQPDPNFSITLKISFEELKSETQEPPEKKRKLSYRQRRKNFLSNSSVVVDPIFDCLEVPNRETRTVSGLTTMKSPQFSKHFLNFERLEGLSVEEVSVEFTTEPVFVAGRYVKSSRKLPQTAFIVDNKRLYPSSVHEEIEKHVISHFLPDSTKFSSCGREDVDVRMLGDGRPFVLEVANPRKLDLSDENLKALEKKINQEANGVVINSLQMISDNQKKILTSDHSDFTKVYRAVIWSSSPFTEKDFEILNLKGEEEFVVDQKTPIRVLHRRTAATRPKRVHSLHFVPLPMDSQGAMMYITTEAGTYIKEFVHGDLGRTTPSVASLLSRTIDILSLDVMHVEVTFPPEE